VAVTLIKKFKEGLFKEEESDKQKDLLKLSPKIRIKNKLLKSSSQKRQRLKNSQLSQFLSKILLKFKQINSKTYHQSMQAKNLLDSKSSRSNNIFNIFWTKCKKSNQTEKSSQMH
jgi:hypothetical protein